MPNIAQLLKTEISRLARKESRGEVEALKKTASAHRSEIAALKRQMRELHLAVNTLTRTQKRNSGSAARQDAQAETENETKFRFSAKGLASNRQRLGLSAADFGSLVGTTGQSIYAWESGKAQPRAKYLAAIASLRGIGKREVAARLDVLTASTKSS